MGVTQTPAWSIKDTKSTLTERTKWSDHSPGFWFKQVCPVFACVQVLREALTGYLLVKTKVKGSPSSEGEDSISEQLSSKSTKGRAHKPSSAPPPPRAHI